MTAVTLQIMVNAPTHDLSYDPAKAAMRHRNGDVIDLIPTAELADLVGAVYKLRGEIRNPRFSFLHITDFPDGERAKLRITETISAASDTLRFRRYRVIFNALPPQARATMQASREITLTWEQAKKVIRKKAITVILDPSQDDESNSIVDADLL